MISFSLAPTHRKLSGLYSQLNEGKERSGKKQKAQSWHGVHQARRRLCRALPPHRVAGHILQRPGHGHAQEQVERWLLSRHPAYHAGGFLFQVRSRPWPVAYPTSSFFFPCLLFSLISHLENLGWNGGEGCRVAKDAYTYLIGMFLTFLLTCFGSLVVLRLPKFFCANTGGVLLPRYAEYFTGPAPDLTRAF